MNRLCDGKLAVLGVSSPNLVCMATVSMICCVFPFGMWPTNQYGLHNKMLYSTIFLIRVYRGKMRSRDAFAHFGCCDLVK